MLFILVPCLLATLVVLLAIWHLRRTREAILRVLIAGPSYAPEIAENIENSLHFKPYAVLYNALHDLEHEGLIEGYWNETNSQIRAGRPRRYYALTTAGRKHSEQIRRFTLLGG